MNFKQKVLLGAALTGMISGTATANQSGDMGPKGGNVECYGVNSCKGKGECGGKDHGCAGMNECKGKGWISLSPQECEEKGGTYKGMKKGK
jgi:hypothetical protein